MDLRLKKLSNFIMAGFRNSLSDWLKGWRPRFDWSSASVRKPFQDTIHDKANEIIICHISKNAEAEINQLHLGACKTVADHEGQRLQKSTDWTLRISDSVKGTSDGLLIRVMKYWSRSKDIQKDFVESFFEARSDASFIVKKYYTKILTECPNILIRKFKIRENVNNIGESIGTAQIDINQVGAFWLEENQQIRKRSWSLKKCLLHIVKHVI